MTDSFLDYGRFGELTYDDSNANWKSRRYSLAVVPMTALGPVEIYVSAPLPTSSRKSNSAASRSKDVNKLVRIRPEFQTGKDVIFDYLSEILLERDYLHEFSNDLLAIGRARYANRSSQTASGSRRKRVWPVAAIPAGSHGNKVCIVELRECKEGWNESRSGRPSTWVESFDLKNTTRGFWEGDGSRIRQICFAPDTDDSHTLLAVRTPISIHLLRPLFATGFVGLEPMAALKTPSHVESDSVDMTFNPWDPRQLAAVDSNGQYVIWNIKETAKNCHTTMMTTNRMRRDESNENQTSNDLPDDGWRRILWVVNKETLVVCSRSHMECFSLSSRLLGESSFNYEHGLLCWTLDMKKSPTQDDELFVLTTQDWIWLRVHASTDKVLFETLLSWKHHRDFNDLSLRLTFHEDLNYLRVMLYSLKDNLITEFCITDRKHLISPALLGGPTTWDWGGSSLQGVKFFELPVNHYKSSTASHWSDRVKFSQVIALGSDLSLSGCWLHDQSAKRKKMEPPSWKSDKDQHPGSVLNNDTGFLVDDDIDENYDSGIDDPGFVTRGESNTDSLVPLAMVSGTAANSVSNEISSNAIHQMIHEDASDVIDVLDSVANMLTGISSNDTLKLQTLATSIPKPLKVIDLDEVFTTAFRLVNQFRVANNLLIFAPLASTVTLGLAEFESSEDFPPMNLFFQRLLSIYNRPLASSLRGTPRLSKEKIVRQVAASIFLASIGVRKESPPEIAHQPNRPRELSTRSTPITASSTRLLGVLTSDPIAESVARLGNYTQINAHPRSSSILSKTASDSMSQILGHWTLQGDPSQYSHRDATATLTGVSSTHGSQLSAAVREDIERREQRTRELVNIRNTRDERRQEVGGDPKRRKLDPRVVQSQPEPSNGVGLARRFEVVESRSHPPLEGQSQPGLGNAAKGDDVANAGSYQAQEPQRRQQQQPSSLSSQIGPKSSQRTAKKKGF